MDARLEKNKGLMERERLVAETSKGGKGQIYRMKPLEDGSVFDNRIVVLLWKPAVVCPEVFAQYYEQDQWDYKAAVRGHWVSDSVTGENSFVFCAPGTAAYYEKWLGKEFEKPACKFCNSTERPNLRFLMQVFDYQKLIGEKDMDEGENRPVIQILSAPQTIYNQLWNKMKVGIDFCGDKIVRITRDTRKGLRFADYMVEVEGFAPEEIKVKEIREYLDDEKNLVNPVPGIIRVGEDTAGKHTETQQKASEVKGPEERKTTVTGGKTIRW